MKRATILLPVFIATLFSAGCATSFSKTTTHGDLSIPIALRAVIGGHARDVVIRDAEVRVASDGFPHIRTDLLYTHVWSGEKVSSQPFQWKFRWRDSSGSMQNGKEGLQGGLIDTASGVITKSISPVRNPSGVIIDIDTGYVSVNQFGRTAPSVTGMFSPSETPRNYQAVEDSLDPWRNKPKNTLAQSLQATPTVTTNIVEVFIIEE